MIGLKEKHLQEPMKKVANANLRGATIEASPEAPS
jgi:hypothetical protein